MDINFFIEYKQRYNHLRQRPAPIAAQLAQEVMSLLMSPDLTYVQQEDVVKTLCLFAS